MSYERALFSVDLAAAVWNAVLGLILLARGKALAWRCASASATRAY